MTGAGRVAKVSLTSEGVDVNNYEFCAQFAQKAANGRAGFKVLDYGCGAGQIIGLMRAAGLEAAGCEAFYEGDDCSSRTPQNLRPYISRMQGDRAPFDDASFDLVINNQVLEHVKDLDIVVQEIGRILRPGGICLSLFPDDSVWREGHCGIPFLHWFPKRTTPRIYYAFVLSSLIFRYHKGARSPLQWSRDVCRWLDDWCYYRPYGDISATFAKHLSPPAHIEPEWFVARRSQARFIPAALRQMVAHKMAGMVFVTKKPVE
jgi:SAM-dependent methyltransferase